MKKLTTFVRNLLSVSPAEAKGTVIIFGIILLLILVMFGADWFFAQKAQNLVISSPKMLDSLTVSLDSRKPNYGNQSHYEQKFEKYDSNKKNYKNFNFDPNTASVEQFEALGLPKFIAERIEKYRSKGGKFRKKEDFAKIYGLLPDTYERLEPYIELPSADDESLRTPQAEATSTERKATSDLPIAEKPNEAKELNPKANLKQPIRFDLNTGDTTDFMRIKGIGSGYAKRIIKFREMLGGFANAEQVKETYGLPLETVDELLKYAFVKSGVRKLKINQLSLTDFRHPYMKYFQAKAIIAYRDQHGPFKNVEDLKQVKVLDEATLLKLLPYIEF